MIKKKKIGLVLALLRRNSSPVFCALLPQVSNFLYCGHVILTYLQEEKEDETGWTEPAGFHLIQLPFADDIRSAPIQEGFQGALFFRSLSNIVLIRLHPDQRRKKWETLLLLGSISSLLKMEHIPLIHILTLVRSSFFILLNDLMIHSPCIPQRATPGKRVSWAIWSRIVWGFDGT